MDKCTVNGKVVLKKSKGNVLTYVRVHRDRALKTNAKPSSRKRWIRKRLAQVVDDVGSHGEDLIVELLRMLAKKEGVMLTKKTDLQLSVAQEIRLEPEPMACIP